jgi:ribonuclease Z
MTFSVSILGSGAAIPLTHRNPSTQLLNIHDQLFLLDCAEGTQLQLRRYHVRFQRINHIFITHLHGDHYYGLIGLITTMHLLGRKEELNLYAYPMLARVIEIQLEASKTELNFPLNFHPVNPEVSAVILDNEIITVRTIPLNHSIPTCGYLFREKILKRNIRKEFLIGKRLTNEEFSRIKEGHDYADEAGRVYKNAEITIPPRLPRSYAYCTDTAYHEPVIPHIRGVSLLYHESSFMDDRAGDAAKKFHSTASQAALIARKAGARKLLLGHYSARYNDLDDLLAEARKVFPGAILGYDGLVIDL